MNVLLIDPFLFARFSNMVLSETRVPDGTSTPRILMLQFPAHPAMPRLCWKQHLPNYWPRRLLHPPPQVRQTGHWQSGGPTEIVKHGASSMGKSGKIICKCSFEWEILERNGAQLGKSLH